MTRIRCGNDFAVDLNQIVAWSKSKRNQKEFINVYLAGADDAIYIYQESIGSLAFSRFHELLLDLFAIDLAAENNPSCDDDIDYSLVDELEDLPY